jgi:phosphatidylserine/phosphatidylglycerophosphate/cardiolipin synthase-like enzyme
VVDGARSFVSSANFTQRGQERNIEVGVLIEDMSFASYLAGQWLRLIETGMVARYGAPSGA